MKEGGTSYSPAFKFQVVLEALKAEGGKEPRSKWPGPTGCTRLHWPMEGAQLKGERTGKRMKGRHASSIITHHA